MAAMLPKAEVQSIITSWPADEEELPPSVKATFDAWSELTVAQLRAPLQELHEDPAAAFITPTGRPTKRTKCITLTAHGVGPPGGPTPIPAELRSMLPDSTTTALESRLRELESQLLEAKSTIASLAKHQDAEKDTDVSADYDVHDEVVQSVPSSFGVCKPLSKKERHQIMRKHIGTFPDGCWPKAVTLKDITKNSKEVQKAKKLSLPQFATEVSAFMLQNDYTSKMAATTWSHLIDLQDECQSRLDDDTNAWLRADELQTHLVRLGEHAQTTFRLGLDMSVFLQRNVAKKVDVAMGIDHLRVDPTKRDKDDFVSDDTYKLVELEAKKKQNLVWAKAGTFADMQAGRFFGRPPSQNPGGGKRKRGNGRGGGTGGSTPFPKRNRSGKGKGRGRSVKSESTASPS